MGVRPVEVVQLATRAALLWDEPGWLVGMVRPRIRDVARRDLRGRSLGRESFLFNLLMQSKVKRIGPG